MPFQYAALTDRGRRRVRNEDSFLAMPDAGVYAVADGMGGHAGGDVASRLAIAALESVRNESGRTGAEQWLDTAFTAAHDALHAAALADPALRDMGTTLTVLALDPAGARGHVAHVGDSRLYLLRRGELRQVTHDDTWVQAQIDAGALTPQQARRHPWAALLTKVVAPAAPAAPSRDTLALHAGDTLLLCSDGLTGMVDDPAIAALLALDAAPAAIAEQLVAAANRNGGADNITAVVVRHTG